MDKHESSPTDAAAVGADEAVTLESVQAELAAVQAELTQLRESVLRERAELENQRRRLQRDLEQARRFANEKLLGDLLPVYDGLERALEIEGGDVATVREGISLTLKSLQKLAESHGLVAIEPQGQSFDPARHQAMSIVESAELGPNIVASVLQKGYLLNDRLLRPALVSVTKDAG